MLEKQPIERAKALAYLRTSSAANVGGDKDSDKRQTEAITRFADGAGFTIVDSFYDAAVSGADPIEERPGFSALLDRIEDNGVRTVIVEDASRFARDMRAHVLGLALLRERGVTLLSAAGGTDLTDDTDEMTEAMISIAAVFAALEKKRLVKKLRSARERKRATGVKVEGRKSMMERDPDAVALAKRLAHGNRKEKLSYREIAKRLADAGHTATSGKAFSPSVIQKMIRGGR